MNFGAKDRNQLEPHEIQPLVEPADVYAEKDGHICMAASRHRIALCESCDNIHFWLLREDGTPFATMTLGTEQVHGFISEVIEAHNAALRQKERRRSE